MIEFNNMDHAARICAAAGVVLNPAIDPCISRSRDGELLGGAVFQTYTGASIQGHFAGFDPRWMSKDLIRTVFGYTFDQLGCKVVFGLVPETNKPALEIDRKLGFKEVAKIEDVFPDGACIVLALAREDCRWLRTKPQK